MIRTDQIFLLLAAACLVVGVSMGIGMGVSHDFQLAPIHAHLNLIGWVSLALFGVAYRAYPELGASRLAQLHLIVSGASGVLFPATLYLAVAHAQPGPAIAASIAWLIGACLFLGNLLRAFLMPKATLRRRASHPLSA